MNIESSLSTTNVEVFAHPPLRPYPRHSVTVDPSLRSQRRDGDSLLDHWRVLRRQFGQGERVYGHHVSNAARAGLISSIAASRRTDGRHLMAPEHIMLMLGKERHENLEKALVGGIAPFFYSTPLSESRVHRNLTTFFIRHSKRVPKGIQGQAGKMVGLFGHVHAKLPMAAPVLRRANRLIGKLKLSERRKFIEGQLRSLNCVPEADRAPLILDSLQAMEHLSDKERIPYHSALIRHLFSVPIDLREMIVDDASHLIRRLPIREHLQIFLELIRQLEFVPDSLLESVFTQATDLEFAPGTSQRPYDSLSVKERVECCTTLLGGLERAPHDRRSDIVARALRQKATLPKELAEKVYDAILNQIRFVPRDQLTRVMDACPPCLDNTVHTGRCRAFIAALPAADLKEISDMAAGIFRQSMKVENDTRGRLLDLLSDTIESILSTRVDGQSIEDLKVVSQNVRNALRQHYTVLAPGVSTNVARLLIPNLE